jgi:hypothetical protein
VPIQIEVPSAVDPGQPVALRVHILNNKVGHDFPTGPLDIIQSWVELRVRDAQGKVVYETGARDERHTIQTGTFMFKAEPVDRYGNLIDKHNLWEMVGVRFKRSLFPGAADVASFEFPCPGAGPTAPPPTDAKDTTTREMEFLPPSGATGEMTVEARLNYRKVDQYLLRFAFGEDTQLTSPVTTIAEASAHFRVGPAAPAPPPAGGASGGRGGR